MTRGLSCVSPAGASGFRTPDDSVVGSAVNLSISISLPSSLGGSIVRGESTPWDTCTAAMGNRLGFVGYQTRSAAYRHETYHYLQFKTPEGLALSILESVGFAGVPAAARERRRWKWRRAIPEASAARETACAESSVLVTGEDDGKRRHPWWPWRCS